MTQGQRIAITVSCAVVVLALILLIFIMLMSETNRSVTTGSADATSQSNNGKKGKAGLGTSTPDMQTAPGGPSKPADAKDAAKASSGSGMTGNKGAQSSGNNAPTGDSTARVTARQTPDDKYRAEVSDIEQLENDEWKLNANFTNAQAREFQIIVKKAGTKETLAEYNTNIIASINESHEVKFKSKNKNVEIFIYLLPDRIQTDHWEP